MKLTPEQLANMEAGACTTCGRPERYRNTAGQCTECHNRGVVDRKAARKAQLAALPRCEVPECKRRGAWKCQGALLCGAHLKRAQRQLALSAPGIIGFLCSSSVDRNIILELASRGES